MYSTPEKYSKKDLAKRILQIRTDAQLSQGQFAAYVGITRVHMNRIEQPEVKTLPSSTLLMKICEVFSVNYDWLTTGEGEMYLKPLHSEIENESSEGSWIIVEQTKEYIALKSDTLLSNTMNTTDFSAYFQVFTSLLDLFFRVISDIKQGFKNKESLSDDVVNTYVKEFKEIIKKDYL